MEGDGPAAGTDDADELEVMGGRALNSNRAGEAVELFRRALALDPQTARRHMNFGVALDLTGRLEEAVLSYRQAATLAPDNVAALANLADAHRRLGDYVEAVKLCRQTLHLRPDFVEVHRSLGLALLSASRFEEAATAFGNAVALRPKGAALMRLLADALFHLGRFEESEQVIRNSLKIDATASGAFNSIGNVQLRLGEVKEAIASFDRALIEQPDNLTAASNRLYAMLYDPANDSAAILARHKAWDVKFGAPLKARIVPHDNERSPDRKLRIGYVSPDFREHVIARNILPLFKEHDREQFEIYCYSNVHYPDSMTERFKGMAHNWCDILWLNDSAAAERIRNDGIDILIDLSLHLGSNRLPLFARKPAPVQITFAGYPGTTGLEAMDWRLTDPHLDTPWQNDNDYVEKSYRLPHSFWCYDLENAETEIPEGSRTFTFGCLNSFTKVNEGVLDLWSRVMRGIPESRLLLMTPPGRARKRTLEHFRRNSIASERIEFVNTMPRQEYLNQFSRIDICLDTLPYNGHTTSLDAMWMGVPVITRVGNTVVGRAGWSQLSVLRLTELAAHDDEQFVKIATELATDQHRISEYHRTLRQRMKDSPLTDARGFTRGVEAAYRAAWRNWCGQ